MARLEVLVAVLIIALLGIPAAAIDAASQATPAAGSVATRDNQEMLDLPALVLQPADVVAVGLGEGFGIYGGNLFALAEAAEIASLARGDVSGARVAEFTTVLEDAGFRQGYYLEMFPPADTPAGVGVGVRSEVDEYADAAGAAAGFAVFADTTELVDVEVEEVMGARRFGDESLTWRGSVVDAATGDPYQLLGIDARIGRFATYVAIYDYANQPPEIAVVEALIERLLARVEREARPARGELAYLVPRLGDEGVVTNDDNYVRLNGVNVPLYGDTAETLASLEAGLSVVRDRYFVGQLAPAGADGTQDDVGYNVALNRFASAEEAAAWLSGYLRGALELPMVADMPPLGDEAITYIRDVDRSDGGVAPGFVTYLRSGKDVLRLAVNGVPGIDRAGYEELLARNVDCLRSGFCLDPLPVPQDLVTGGVIATPQAASQAASPAAAATPETVASGGASSRGSHDAWAST